MILDFFSLNDSMISERYTLFCTVFIWWGTISGFSKMLPLKEAKIVTFKVQYNIVVNVGNHFQEGNRLHENT